MDLVTIWAVLIAFAIAAYVVMDGFDLGIGILFPRFKVGDERDDAMNSIAPVWDGNETWLVLGGGGLMAAFPLAYAVILPALYVPLIAMLLGIIFRGVAFEFRWRDPAHRAFWDWSFAGGSLVATLAQGVSLGALLQGIEVQGRAYAGGWFDWLTAFSVLTGAALVVGYALLGSCWLIWKTEGTLQAQAYDFAYKLGFALGAAILAVSIATPFLEAQYHERWLSWPAILVVAPVPVVTALLLFLYFRALAARREAAPFFLALGLFALCLIGIGISIWPDVIPGRVTIWEAAAPERSLSFLLYGAAVLIPVILIYTGWAYWVFRGKVGKGYH